MTIPAGFHTYSGTNNKVTGTTSGNKVHQEHSQFREQSQMEMSAAPEQSMPIESSKKAPAGADRQQLCIDLLMAGCVQSFIDYFYIVNRRFGEDEGVPGDVVEIPNETLVFLKETLEAAESARRIKNYHHCVEHYNVLSEYFEKVTDLKSAMYFYQRCSDVATEAQAKESIGKANLNLGVCEEKQNNWESAVSYLEKALACATEADALPLKIKTAARLVHVYRVLAEKVEADNGELALEYYTRCLKCAGLSTDSELEGLACHRLGKCQHNLGKYQEGIDLQLQFLDICKTHDDKGGEAAARAALAHGYEATGSSQDAVTQLEQLLAVANDAGELEAQAGACLNLGLLYNDNGDNEKSIELLEQHFDLARQIGDRRLIDSARVILGMARGNGKIDRYVHAINFDLDKLMKWKSKRTPL